MGHQMHTPQYSAYTADYIYILLIRRAGEFSKAATLSNAFYNFTRRIYSSTSVSVFFVQSLPWGAIKPLLMRKAVPSNADAGPPHPVVHINVLCDADGQRKPGSH